MVERSPSRQPVLFILWKVGQDEVVPVALSTDEVICTIEGPAVIRCPVCGQNRRWVEQKSLTQ